MKIKIAQYYFGNDKKYLELANLSKQITANYCNIHGYYHDFKYYNFDNLPNRNNYPADNIAFLFKPQFIYDSLKDCDYLVFIDADGFISNPNIKIEDLIDNQHEIFFDRGNGKVDFLHDFKNLYNHMTICMQKYQNEMTNNWKQFCIDYNKQTGFNFFKMLEHLSIGNRYMNAGLIIIKNTSKMQKMFKLCSESINMFINPDSFTADERTMSFCLTIPEFQNCDAYLPLYTQGHVYGSFENRYDEDKTFLLHCYGPSFSIDYRISVGNQIKHNKWWNNIQK